MLNGTKDVLLVAEMELLARLVAIAMVQVRTLMTVVVVMEREVVMF